MEHENELKEALDFLSPSALSYEEWTTVGMALKQAGYPASVWELWSSRDAERYHKGECTRKWESFHGSAQPVTESSIFQLAYRQGWTGPAGHALDWNDEISSDNAAPVDGRLVDPRWVEVQELSLPPEWHPAEELKRYLQALFEPDEHVAYVAESYRRDGRPAPTKGCWDRTAGQLIEELERCGDDVGKVVGDCDPDAGAWICFNPVEGGRNNANVTDFRYALVECDNMELGKQLAIIKQLELPCAALVYSGGKSVHAIVKVNAPDYTEYRKRVDYLYSACQKNGLTLDQQNRNPSRLSRMPGILRGGHRQALLETNVGKSCWEEWQDWLESETDELPEDEDLGDDCINRPPKADELIQGVLRKGHKMLLAGPSKAGKSFALIELCIAIATGSPWFGRFSCAQGKVYYVNLELDRASCIDRFVEVYKTMGYPEERMPEILHNIRVWNLRGRTVPMDKLAPKLIRRAGKKGYSAVIIDPIYKVLTGDENNAEQMAKFCNQFDYICRELDCAVIYCHHHSKGAQGGKRSMDRASGSGVFARDPDAMLDMTELMPTDAIREQLHNKAACAVIKRILDKRGFADSYGPDDALSRSRMLTIAKEHLGLSDLRQIDAEVAAANKKADSLTAWRIEGTLREFPRFDSVNLWFDYPVHKLDSGLLEDLQPENDARTTGRFGAAKRWSASPAERQKQSREKSSQELSNAYEACMMDGKVTVYALAEYLGLKPDTVRRRIKADGSYWMDGTDVGRREPGSSG